MNKELVENSKAIQKRAIAMKAIFEKQLKKEKAGKAKPKHADTETLVKMVDFIISGK